MTSHLESCKGHAEERMKQLRLVMQRMRDAPEDVTVLFGGDTNLRDTEVRHLLLNYVPLWNVFFFFTNLELKPYFFLWNIIVFLCSIDVNWAPQQVTKVGLPPSVCDVWERLGKQEHCRYTWDTKANSNKTVPFVSRCRFDRIYLRPATKNSVPCLAPDHMALVGLEKLDCGRYTSDHWGIYCSFSVG